MMYMSTMYSKNFQQIRSPLYDLAGEGECPCHLVANRNTGLNQELCETKLYAMRILVNCILFDLLLDAMVL
jgi:hypothetical protein